MILARPEKHVLKKEILQVYDQFFNKAAEEW
jgi:hypothetical protein